jgi:hypothetical protein
MQKISEKELKSRRAAKLVKRLFADAQPGIKSTMSYSENQMAVPDSGSDAGRESRSGSQLAHPKRLGKRPSFLEAALSESSLRNTLQNATPTASSVADEDVHRLSAVQHSFKAGGSNVTTDMQAWEDGNLPCSRCMQQGEQATHALMCPNFDVVHSYFKPLCFECREALEVVFEDHIVQTLKRKQVQDESEIDPESSGTNTPEPISARFNVPVRPEFSAEMNVLAHSNECCLAIEFELHLTIEPVKPDRHQLLLDEIRDEVHRALQVPTRQIFVLQDDASKTGTFQVGILHPWLVPTQRQRQQRQRRIGRSRTGGSIMEKLEDGPDVDLELTDAAEDLGQTWDRLVAFFYGDAARHRKEISNAFPLLRCRRRDVAALQLATTLVVPSVSGQALVETILSSKDQVPDDGGTGEDSDFEDEFMASLSLPDEDEATTHPNNGAGHKSSGRRHSTKKSELGHPKVGTPRRKIKFNGDPETESANKFNFFQAAEPADASLKHADIKKHEAETARVSVSSLRSPCVKDLLTVLPEVPGRTVIDTETQHNLHKRSTKHFWMKEAQDLGLLPLSAEINRIHMPACHLLVWQGDRNALIAALEHSTSAFWHSSDRMGRTPLHIAAAHCQLDIVKLLVSSAASGGPIKLDECDMQGRAALHYAAYRGDASIMACFIQALMFSSIDIAERLTGDTSVLIASRAVHDNVLRELLQAAASANICNKRGLAPLHVAAAAGSVACCEMLLKSSANVDALDALDRSPMEWAALYQNIDVEDMFRKHQSAQDKNMEMEMNTRTWTWGIQSASTKTDLPSGSTIVTPRRPKTQASRRRPAPTQFNPIATPRAATAPLCSQRDKLRDLLLAGGCTNSSELANLGCDGWAGNAGSLAVRWRNWAQGAFPDSPQVAFSKGICCSRGPCAVPAERKKGTLQRVLPKPAPLEPTRAQLADAAESLGAVFCTVCWEYVLEGHQTH